jgi:hypothetical protein
MPDIDSVGDNSAIMLVIMQLLIILVIMPAVDYVWDAGC